jgi:BirA family biotin operon repressor/biotin-[acetyl-CoA-carboxylase] ligase
LSGTRAGAAFFSRHQRFSSVGSTNDVVRGWLGAGIPEVCLAIADEQTAGRGREGRSWVAPAGTALLVSLGFRPTWLAPEHVWRLAAIVSLAMADAAEDVARLGQKSIRLKWPNDLVIAEGRPADPLADSVRKLAGVLGETDGLASTDPRAIIGIGLNADWPASEFPDDLASTMTSLREASDGRPIDRSMLLDAFGRRVETRTLDLRAGRFDVEEWTDRQVTTGRQVLLEEPNGAQTSARAIGVDADSGALIVADEAGPRGRRRVLSGEIRHVRLADRSPVAAQSRGTV